MGAITPGRVDREPSVSSFNYVTHVTSQVGGGGRKGNTTVNKTGQKLCSQKAYTMWRETIKKI